MYGYKGGNRANCEYPTVAKIRRKFYEIYPGVPLDSYDRTKGEIPIVGERMFRYVDVLYNPNNNFAENIKKLHRLSPVPTYPKCMVYHANNIH